MVVISTSGPVCGSLSLAGKEAGVAGGSILVYLVRTVGLINLHLVQTETENRKWKETQLCLPQY